MQAEYSQKKNRIKLRVTTSTGLNLLCTANRSQKIKQLLPHIVKLYEEVKEDQGIAEEDKVIFRPFIKYIRKDQFLIAPSELVGDIFDDNDEVFCEIGNGPYTEHAKKDIARQEKHEKASKKLPTETKTQTLAKTKKIKKKDANKQHQKTEQKIGNQDSKKQPLPQKKQLPNTKTEENKQPNNPDPTKTPKSPAINHTSQQNKPKKKKNKNKPHTTSNPSQPSQQTIQQKTQNPQLTGPKPSAPKIIHTKKPTTSGSQKQKNQQKKPAQQQKSSTSPLLSSQDLRKIKQMLKKSSSASSPA